MLTGDVVFHQLGQPARYGFGSTMAPVVGGELQFVRHHSSSLGIAGRPDDLRNHALWLIYRPECDRFGGCWRVNAQAATASTDDRRMTRTYLKIASYRGRAISVG